MSAFLTPDQFENVWPKIQESDLGFGKTEESKAFYFHTCCESRDVSSFRMPGGKLTPRGEIFVHGHRLVTHVVNVYKEPYDVYIGRAGGGIYGNPIKLSNPSCEIARYECAIEFINHLLEFEPKVLDRVEELHGKAIGCHCAPRLCHGHIYKELAKVERAQYRPVLKDLLLRATKKLGVLKVEDHKKAEQILLF